MNGTVAGPTQAVPELPERRVLVGITTVIGTALLLAAAWLSLVSVPRALNTEQEFRAARPCPAGPATAAPDCLRSVSAVIERTTLRGPKSRVLWLHVKDAEGGTPALEFKDEGDKPYGNLVGKRIGLTYWEGSVRYVDWANARWYTADDPRGGYRAYLAWALGLTTAGAGLILIGLWWIRGYKNTRLRYPESPALLGVATASLTGLSIAIAWLAPGWGAALKGFGVAAVVVAGACALAILLVRRANTRKETDTIEVAPVVPTEESVFGGAVRGDVPYAGPLGDGYLIAEPGRLSIIPDPDYRLHPRVVPSTLKPVRVRPVYRTDPFDAGEVAWVVECRDGETPVFIATAKANIPVLLGALTSANGPGAGAEGA
ncbi:hypothetical protein [Streptomyces xanthochromogenes]|uniref:hypothetical protein n=1 Tax=Streptomyces xanthochromogenes TaxID=67384 RepID=UPI002F41C8E3